MNKKWDSRWMGLARYIAEWSGDPSTKVGAVIIDEENNVISLGWNDMCRGVADLPERRVRPDKYAWTPHAEANAVYNTAGRSGAVGTCKIYCTLFPCNGCAQAIVQATGLKIVEIIAPECDLTDERYGWPISVQIFKERGIKYRFYEEKEGSL